MWIMACLPIIVLLLLLIKFQWGATEAAPIGLLITIVTAVAFYKADFELLASETAKGIWSALPILLIVWTAILLYQVADEAKAFLVIRNGMRKLLPNELLLVLALGFCYSILGEPVPFCLGCNHRTHHVLVLRKRERCEKRASGCHYPGGDPGRRRAFAQPGDHDAVMLYSVLRFPGGIIPDRKDENVP